MSYKNGNIELFNMDCMELMKSFPDKYFDLACVDPPYGIEADKKNSGKTSDSHARSSAAHINEYKTGWDSEVPTEKYFLELKRVSKHQIIWGVNYYPYGLFAGGRIYWDKQVTMPTYSDGELAYCSKINSIRCYSFAWHGMIQGDMKNKEVRIHPTQKPVKLYDWLLANYAKPEHKILDTHLGSGSSAIAAHYYGCAEFVGCELDKDYYDAAIKRFEMQTAQATLF